MKGVFIVVLELNVDVTLDMCVKVECASGVLYTRESAGEIGGRPYPSTGLVFSGSGVDPTSGFTLTRPA